MNTQIQDTMCGFDTINEIAKKTKIDLNKNKFDGIYGQGVIKRRKGNSLKTTKIYEFKRNSCKKVCRFFQNRRRQNNNHT